MVVMRREERRGIERDMERGKERMPLCGSGGGEAG